MNKEPPRTRRCVGALALKPIFSVEGTVLDGFAEMLGFNAVASRKVGNGAADF